MPSQDTCAAPPDLDALEALAKAATPGPWRWKHTILGPDEWGDQGPDLITVDGHTESCPYYCVGRDEQGVEYRGTGPETPHEHWYPRATILYGWGHDASGVGIKDADANYIAAANPQTILALIERIRQLES